MTHEEFVRAAGDLVLAGSAAMDKSKDQDQSKGAVEQDQNKQGGNTSMSGQLGHRDAELKAEDSGFSG